MLRTFVIPQLAATVETFTAQGTLVRLATTLSGGLATSMKPHVSDSTSTLTKRLVTHATFVRLLSRVDPHVSF